MSSAQELSHSVDHFAEFSAEMDDLFADRAAVLARAGLDDEAWMHLNERWLALFQAPEGDHRAARFAEVFAATKKRVATAGGAAASFGKTESTIPGERGFLSAAPQPWRAEAAEVGDAPASRPPPLALPQAASTGEVSPGAAPDADPPAGSGVGGRFAPEVAHVDVQPAAASAPRRSAVAVPHPLAGTVDADTRSAFGQALPFVAPPPDDPKGTLPVGARVDEIWPFPLQAPPSRDSGAPR
jgi:hypothetical protein